MNKAEFYTSASRARAVPVDAVVWNHTWVQDNKAIGRMERTKASLSFIRTPDEMLVQDLWDLLGIAPVPELARSPEESADSVHAEGSSSREPEGSDVDAEHDLDDDFVKPVVPRDEEQQKERKAIMAPPHDLDAGSGSVAERD